VKPSNPPASGLSARADVERQREARIVVSKSRIETPKKIHNPEKWVKTNSSHRGVYKKGNQMQAKNEGSKPDSVAEHSDMG
jgi:hypothetical protein